MRSIAGRFARAIDADSAHFMELCTTGFIRRFGIAARTSKDTSCGHVRVPLATDEQSVI